MRFGAHLRASLACAHELGNIFVVTRGVHVDSSYRVLIGTGLELPYKDTGIASLFLNVPKTNRIHSVAWVRIIRWHRLDYSSHNRTKWLQATWLPTVPPASEKCLVNPAIQMVILSVPYVKLAMSSLCLTSLAISLTQRRKWAHWAG